MNGPTTEVKPLGIREWFCNEVASRIAYPYIWGAFGPYQFDCCGLVQWASARIGRPFDHDICAADLLDIFHTKKVIRGAEGLGSLYLYTSKKNREKISHVCIYFRQWGGQKWLIGANGGCSATKTEAIALSSEAMVKVVKDSYRLADLHTIVDPFRGEE